MKRARRGVLLAEVLVAIAVAGGAMLGVFTLVQSNLAAARRVGEIADVEGVLADLAVELIDRPIADLRRDAGSTLPVDQILALRCQGLPDVAAASLADVNAHLVGHVSYRIEESPGGMSGLAVIDVTATFSPDSSVTLTRLFRPRPEEAVR